MAGEAPGEGQAMTFEEWYEKQPITILIRGKGFYKDLWETATREERERCAKITLEGQEGFVNSPMTADLKLSEWIEQAIGRMAHSIASRIRSGQ